MPTYFRKRRTLHLPITLSVILLMLVTGLMVWWIVVAASSSFWTALTIGTVLFVMTLVALSWYMVLTIKEVRLNQRQANFVDSVTHELKSPLASLKLYVETLQLRKVGEREQAEFYRFMADDLERLDRLISQLLEVSRLDEIGARTQLEDVPMDDLIRTCAVAACIHQKQSLERVFCFDIEPATVRGPRIVLEMIFRNLLDNAIKYAADEPRVEVEVRVGTHGRVVTRVADNGPGVPVDRRKKIFQLFYRGENELVRRKTGTGLGLYIVNTLVRKLKGRIAVYNRIQGSGSVFEVELPGKTASCAS